MNLRACPPSGHRTCHGPHWQLGPAVVPTRPAPRTGKTIVAGPLVSAFVASFPLDRRQVMCLRRGLLSAILRSLIFVWGRRDPRGSRAYYGQRVWWVGRAFPPEL